VVVEPIAPVVVEPTAVVKTDEQKTKVVNDFSSLLKTNPNEKQIADYYNQNKQFSSDLQ
jgi:tripartite-type tricarboxylate transporter receptor subunit TctC